MFPSLSASLRVRVPKGWPTTVSVRLVKSVGRAKSVMVADSPPPVITSTPSSERFVTSIESVLVVLAVEATPVAQATVKSPASGSLVLVSVNEEIFASPLPPAPISNWSAVNSG